MIHFKRPDPWKTLAVAGVGGANMVLTEYIGQMVDEALEAVHRTADILRRNKGAIVDALKGSQT